jgi:LPS export ABC transporter protein LptC
MVCKEKVLLILKGILFPLPASILAFLAIICLLPGCSEDAKPKNAVTHVKIAPLMSAKNVEVTFSDSGKIAAKLFSVLINRYEGKDPYMEFPKGFQILMYDSAKRVETSIRGDYGKRRENQKIMEARGNVVVRNEIKKQQLNTEHLIWDENRRMIYSDVKVKITTPDKVLYVYGLESDESFSWYKFSNVTGEMTVRKDSL